MSLFRTLTNRSERDDPIKNGKRVSQMNELELWEVLQDLTESQLKGTWATTITRKVKDRRDLMEALCAQYCAQMDDYNKQVENFNKANVTEEHLDVSFFNVLTLSTSSVGRPF
jgi:hypothetical protein